MTTSAFGSGLSFRVSERACGGRLDVYRWSFTAPSIGSLAKELGRAYVKDKQWMLHPEAAVAPRLAREGHSSRTGDVGELLAAALYERRLGGHVPFRKLQLKPQGNSTLQSADVLALTLTDPTSIEPVTVEVKARVAPVPSKMLREMKSSTQIATEEYLRAAWVTGVQLMEDHPDHERHFALSAAYHLALMHDSGRRQRPHAHHGVMVVGNDNLSRAKIEEYWDSDPPVSELHIIVVSHMAELRDAVFEAAAELTYGDLAESAPTLLRREKLTPGVGGAISSVDATTLASSPDSGVYSAVVESALWYLADWDGLGLARARAGAESSNHCVRGLSSILSGAVTRAVTTLGESDLADFAVQARAVMQLQADADADALRQSASETSAAVDDAALAHAVRYVAAAILHRLPRHPKTMVAARNATGSIMGHVVDRMTRIGRYALWPPQADAVEGGLLDKNQPSLAIKMPTSAGKTLLIELLAADALDSYQAPSVAVLAPTKALVSQLASDLRAALPREISVLSSHGGLDYDLEGPQGIGAASTGGVTVMTPERFDLDWRRAATDDDYPGFDNLRLLIIDEAHLINDPTRGASLELSIARALRHSVRVVVLSSQFADMGQIGDWLGGGKIESTWRPTWLDRMVYTRSDDRSEGWLCDEQGSREHIFDLKPSKKSDGDGCPRLPQSETAELVARQAADGLVVVFTNQKRYIDNLVTEVHERLGPLAESDEQLEQLADGVESSHENVATFLRDGVGLHHGDLSRSARSAVETAARKLLLRCVVCTPTLLEGVDFPARSVIAAYPPERRGRPEIARLRNLAGRAGRGGLFPSGRFIVRTTERAHASKWLRAFREQLPPTTSALTKALRNLLNATHRLTVDGAVPEVVDALLLAAFADGAAADGDLREALEEALGRTLWYSTTHPNERVRTFQNAVGRAAYVFTAVGDREVSRAFYRSGLPLQSCQNLRHAIAPNLANVVGTLDDSESDHDDLLLFLATEIAPMSGAPLNWHELDIGEMRNATRRWLDGAPTTDIAAEFPETWPKMHGHPLESLLPWVLTGTVEIVAAIEGRTDLRDLAHRRLGLSRVRYGVPDESLCKLVRDGHDRVLVAQHAREFESDVPVHLRHWWAVESFVEKRFAGEQIADALDDGFAFYS